MTVEVLKIKVLSLTVSYSPNHSKGVYIRILLYFYYKSQCQGAEAKTLRRVCNNVRWAFFKYTKRRHYWYNSTQDLWFYRNRSPGVWRSFYILIILVLIECFVAELKAKSWVCGRWVLFISHVITKSCGCCFRHIC